MAVREDMFKQLTETNISEGSRQLLRNYVSADLVLAYFDAGELNEMKWRLRQVKELFINAHPAHDSEVTGQDRAYINDDPHDTLNPLSDQQLLAVESFFDMLIARLTRAKEMKQQEMMNTRIQERRDNSDSGQSGGIAGKLGLS